MGLIGKAFACIMFPLSILIIFDALQVLSIKLPFDKILVGALLMIALQVLTLVFLKINHGKLGIMQFLTAGVFCLVALLAVSSSTLSLSFAAQMPLILGVVMFVETIYALH